MDLVIPLFMIRSSCDHVLHQDWGTPRHMNAGKLKVYVIEMTRCSIDLNDSQTETGVGHWRKILPNSSDK